MRRGLLHCPMVLHVLLANDAAERIKLIDDMFAGTPKIPNYEPHDIADFWFGIAADRQEIERLVRDDIIASARHVGLTSFDYVLQVGVERPVGDRMRV